MSLRVTVAGDMVTYEVTPDQVRAYLRTKGFTRQPDDRPLLRDHGVEVWGSEPNRRVWIGCLPGGDPARTIGDLVLLLARWEGRTPATVLREIAGDVEERRTRIERRADEIEAESRTLTFEDALRFALICRDDDAAHHEPGDPDPDCKKCALDAAAFLIVAQRMYVADALIR